MKVTPINIDRANPEMAPNQIYPPEKRETDVSARSLDEAGEERLRVGMPSLELSVRFLPLPLLSSMQNCAHLNIHLLLQRHLSLQSLLSLRYKREEKSRERQRRSSDEQVQDGSSHSSLPSSHSLNGTHNRSVRSSSQSMFGRLSTS